MKLSIFSLFCIAATLITITLVTARHPVGRVSKHLTAAAVENDATEARRLARNLKRERDPEEAQLRRCLALNSTVRTFDANVAQRQAALDERRKHEALRHRSRSWFRVFEESRAGFFTACLLSDEIIALAKDPRAYLFSACSLALVVFLAGWLLRVNYDDRDLFLKPPKLPEKASSITRARSRSNKRDSSSITFRDRIHSKLNTFNRVISTKLHALNLLKNPSVQVVAANGYIKMVAPKRCVDFLMNSSLFALMVTIVVLLFVAPSFAEWRTMYQQGDQARKIVNDDETEFDPATGIRKVPMGSSKSGDGRGLSSLRWWSSSSSSSLATSYVAPAFKSLRESLGDWWHLCTVAAPLFLASWFFFFFFDRMRKLTARSQLQHLDGHAMVVVRSGIRKAEQAIVAKK